MSLYPSRLSAIVSNGLRPVRLIRSEEGRQVWHARDHRGRRLTLVRARSSRAVKKVRQEIALLRALGARNTPAVPALKWRGAAAYAIAEGPSALAPPRGKRAERGSIAGAGAGEAQAASDLTALLSTLHSQNLALGLQGVRGLELAPNGRVVVTDFSRVTDLTPVSKRHDEQWRERLTSGGGTYRYAHRRAGGVTEATSSNPQERATLPTRSEAARADRATRVAPRFRHQDGHSRRSGRNFRRLSFGLGAIAVVACALLAGATAPATAPQSSATAASQHAVMEDPASVITALAAGRHRYLVGATSENTSAAPGSEAEADDEKLRAAIAHAHVDGGDIRILNARTLDCRDNSARVRVRVIDSGARIMGAGESRELSESEPYELDVKLERVRGAWRISSTAPVSDGQRRFT